MSHARIFGFVAAEADVCVLLRSGPGKWTLMLRWNLATDEFEAGQWLCAWIEDGELSPDGRLFAYQAYKSMYRPRRYFARTIYYYNVVSRPPYFTALAFWDTSYVSKRLRWSEQDPCAVTTPTKGAVPETFQRRIRLETIPDPSWNGRIGVPPPSGRPSSVGPLVLYRERGEADLYSLNDDILEADWADVDHRGRLLFARKGRIYVRDADGERELIDLNPFEFRPLAPPKWATKWPE